jgi:alpha-tubulin suppressor-like RCC1 family protein
MRKYLLIICLFFLIVFSVSFLVNRFGLNNTRASGPISISNCVQLQGIQDNLSGNYVLTQNIDCTYDTQNPSGALYNGGEGFESIGYWDGGSGNLPFTGTFDGKGYSITGLFMNYEEGVGLFTYVYEGTISNINLVNVEIRGNHPSTGTGGLVGYLELGTIRQSSVSGLVVGNYSVGGLVGLSQGYIYDCYSAAEVVSTNGGDDNSGGLVGINNVYSNLRNIASISAGGMHSLALDTSGNVWAWGGTWSGALGNGIWSGSLAPVQVVGGEQGGTHLENIASISASSGGGHSLGLDIFGNVWAWGANDYGQLGNNDNSESWVPVKVLGGEQGGTHLENIASISAGGSHSLALDILGNVWAWGENYEGQLGNNDDSESWVPIKVLGGEQGGAYLENITSVSAGYYFNLALDTLGNVWAWGENYEGQLGNNANSDSWVPVRVLGGEQGGTHLENITNISAGDYSSALALDTSGNVWAWGYNGYGQLGNNDDSDSWVPVRVLGGEQGGTYLENITSVSAGGDEGLALDIFGNVWLWGYQSIGSSWVPVQVLGGEQGGTHLENITSISAGYSMFLALDNAEKLWSWGYNWVGCLGNGTDIDSNIPVQVISGEQGDVGGIIKSSYSIGNIEGENVLGGLVGWNLGEIWDSYSTGDLITSSGQNIGGLVGLNESIIINSYWYESDINTGLSCWTDSDNVGSDEGCTSVESEEYFFDYDNPPMSMSSEEGWDFENVWDASNNGQGYAVLGFSTSVDEEDEDPPGEDLDEDIEDSEEDIDDSETVTTVEQESGDLAQTGIGIAHSFLFALLSLTIYTIFSISKKKFF